MIALVNISSDWYAHHVDWVGGRSKILMPLSMMMTILTITSITFFCSLKSCSNLITPKLWVAFLNDVRSPIVMHVLISLICKHVDNSFRITSYYHFPSSFLVCHLKPLKNRPSFHFHYCTSPNIHGETSSPISFLNSHNFSATNPVILWGYTPICIEHISTFSGFLPLKPFNLSIDSASTIHHIFEGVSYFIILVRNPSTLLVRGFERIIDDLLVLPSLKPPYHNCKICTPSHV